MPVGYHEVVPGDTIQGKVNINLFSQPALRPLLNRMYADAYAFYVPYRLLDETFPDFISKRDLTATVPLVTDLFPQNFEKWFSHSLTENTAWLRRAYNLIWRHHFSESGYVEGASLDGNALLNVLARPSTFDSSTVVDPADTDGEEIPSATTVNTDDIREALARDQFNKMRAYYGKRYVDYLAAVGVKASWNTLDAPELIGKVHTDWKMRLTTADAATELGDSAGYFNSTPVIDLNRTFCPEHGLIAIVACVRGDVARVGGMNHPALVKTEHDDYWSPEYSTVKNKAWQSSLFEQGGSVTELTTFATPEWEDLRKGININADPELGWGTPDGAAAYTAWMSANETSRNFKENLPNTWDKFFRSDRMFSFAHYQITAQHRLTKMSPIPKHGVQKPLY